MQSGYLVRRRFQSTRDERYFGPVGMKRTRIGLPAQNREPNSICITIFVAKFVAGGLVFSK